jgi:hypothetical protein
MSLNFFLKIEKVLSKESYRGVRAAMCCSLKCYQHFPREMMRLLKHEFWNESFEEKSTHTLDIPKRLHRSEDCNYAKFVTFQERDVCEIA